MLDSISYQQKNSKNSRNYVNCHKKLYNNMNLYFCSDLGYQKLVKSMAKIYIKTYIYINYILTALVYVSRDNYITWFRNGSNLLQLRGYVQCHKG